MHEKNDTSLSIPIQYEEFEDVFEKKNVDILPEHQLSSMPLIIKTEPSHHLVQYTICHRLNF